MATSHMVVLAGTLLAIPGVLCVLAALLLRSSGRAAEHSRSTGGAAGDSRSAGGHSRSAGERPAGSADDRGARLILRSGGARRFLRSCRPIGRRFLTSAAPAAQMKRAFVLRGRADAAELRRLDRRLRAAELPVRAPAAPGLDQLAGDLRRLGRQRLTGPALGSERWLAALGRAYDRRLELACDALGVAQHLRQLSGMDRDIERVRMQGRLQETGLDLR